MTCLLVACGPRVIQVPTSGTQDVRIVEMPYRASCYIEDPPDPPPAIDLNFEDEDVIRRTTVHIGQYNLMQQWAADMQVWIGTMRSCLYQITGQEP